MKAQAFYDRREKYAEISGTDLHYVFDQLCGDPSPRGNVEISNKAIINLIASFEADPHADRIIPSFLRCLMDAERGGGDEMFAVLSAAQQAAREQGADIIQVFSFGKEETDPVYFVPLRPGASWNYQDDFLGQWPVEAES